MDGDLLDYCVVGMPFEDFLEVFLPQTTVTRSVKAQVFSEARPDCDVTERPTRGTKRARPGDDLHPKPAAYGRYIGLDDNRLNTGTSECQDIKLLPDIFEDTKAADKQLKDGDASVSEALVSIQEAHSVSERVSSFVLFVTEDYFRIIRADRDGLIVTERTKWVDSEISVRPQNADDLIHRFKGLTNAQLGFDQTTCSLLAEDSEYRERAIQALKRYSRRATSKPAEKLTVYKIGVPCRTIFAGYTPVGPNRIRRVYDTVPRADTWRSIGDNLLPEAEVIAQLNAENVDTVTHEYVDTPWNKGRRRHHGPRVHHRFAVDLGQPLWKFKSSKHMMQILHDAFTCHRQAVQRCRILHRDISAWNILWDETSGRGILSDWDQCARMPPLVGPFELDPSINMMAELPPSDGRRPERTGTWAFVSTLSLNHRHKLHDVQDDLESFFWVAVFMIILYLPVDREAALRVVENVLSQVQYSTDGVPFGGDGKRTFISGVSDRFRLVFTEPVSAPLLEWIGMYRRMVRQWVAYQDGLRSWLGRQRRRELARQSEAEGKGDGDGSGDEGASGEDDESDEDDEDEDDEDDDGGDEDEYVVDSMDDEDNDPEPQAPSLRDYQKRDREWRLILKKGRNRSTVQEGGAKKKGAFKKNNRLSGELHDLNPWAVIAKYSELVQDERQKETKLNAMDCGAFWSRA
ncbi:hypothetical protein K525DRAFT_273255 [Schizophyllum commune Loenen D]|nr:hypothetical protein K525DRAFT_273255 [Schizophyllum commune Loenen D]